LEKENVNNDKLNDNRNILIFIDWFTPGFKAGGPIKSISNIIKSLHTNFNFYIITSDRDIDEPLPYPEEKFNQWIKKDQYQIAYLSGEKRKEFITNTLNKQDFDTYYFNSLYSSTYTLEPFRLIKKIKTNPNVIIAPRGMLGKGALKIKPLKKKVFLTITKATGFFKYVTWHATDIEETEDIKIAFGKKVKIYNTPNIAIIDIKETLIPKKEDELNLVFFSRISPKKNLLFALEILKNFTDKNLSLDIYGSIEDEIYWEKCKDFITQNNIKAKYISTLNPIEVEKTLSNYHFLLFPTLHENYGHVIVESLTAGCGLIISANTPWRNLKRNSIGWDIDLDNKKAFIETINVCLDMNQEQYNTYRKNAYQFIVNETNKQNAIELTHKMFLQ
jgi:glycosyltransferase involved in cell wall biosynthesis